MLEPEVYDDSNWSGDKMDNEDNVFLHPGDCSIDFGNQTFSHSRRRSWCRLPKQKRKRKDDDCCSVMSLDLTKEPSLKRKRALARVASLATMLSPVRPVRKVGQVLQRSWSMKMASPSTTKMPPAKDSMTPYKKPQPTPTKKRPSKLWSDTFQPTGNEGLTAVELKRQEAIYELYQGEEDLIEDLKLAKTAYRDSMKQLKLLSETELQQIFGTLDHLLPLHEDLVQRYQAERKPDGTTEGAGRIMIEWLPGLRRYVTYCGNLVYAKALLDEKKQDPRVEDFLQRCLESPFSRKLDLWNFLDVPRSRLVKYPLLFKNIQKLSPPDHPDVELLNTAIKIVEDIILEVDEKTGESKCQFIINRLEYLEEKQRDPLVEQSKVLLCAGILRNNRGTKLHVFLFKDVLVLTRPATRAERMCYQVYRQPITASCLVLEDLQDGDTSKMGSFRNAFGHSQGAKNMFRVSSKDPAGGQAHTLQANDEHDKKQWVQCLKRAINESQDQSSCSTVDRSPPAKRR